MARTNKKHFELMKRSMSEKWNEEDKAAVEAGLENFEGLPVVAEFFRRNYYRKLKCCLCGCYFYDKTGCNPWPIVDTPEDGEDIVCCQSCNGFVLNARMSMR